jgi:hypothetical protein
MAADRFDPVSSHDQPAAAARDVVIEFQALDDCRAAQIVECEHRRGGA